MPSFPDSSTAACPPRRRRFLSLFRRKSAPRVPDASDPLELQAEPVPPRKARLSLFPRRSSSVAALPTVKPSVASSTARVPTTTLAAPAAGSSTPHPQLPPRPASRASFVRRPSVTSACDVFSTDLPERSKTALGMVSPPSITAAATGKTVRDSYFPPFPSGAPRLPDLDFSSDTPRRFSLHRSGSENYLPRLLAASAMTGREGAQTPAGQAQLDPVLGPRCMTSMDHVERDDLSPIPSARAALVMRDDDLHAPSEPHKPRVNDAIPDPMVHTPSQWTSSEMGDTQSLPPSPLFPSHPSDLLDRTSDHNVVSTVVSDSTSTASSTHRGSVVCFKAFPWVTKPNGPFTVGAVPTRENALPATAWATIELALPKFHQATQRKEAGSHSFERAKLLRLVLQPFLRMEQDRPLVRPDAPSAPSTPRSTMASLSEFHTSAPPSPAASTLAFSPLSPAAPQPSAAPASTSPATAKQRAAEQAYLQFNDPRARTALLLDWIAELMRSLKSAQTAGERMAMLESINMLLEARNLSEDALLAPQVSVEHERYDDTLFNCLEYAVNELNRKGVYHNNLIYAGRLLSLALIRVPGVAHKLLGALPVSPVVLDRVSRVAKWGQIRPTGTAWDQYLACFPASLHSICFDDSRSYLSRVRANRLPQEPPEDVAPRDLFQQSREAPTTPTKKMVNLVEHKGRAIAMEGNWLRRFQSDDSEVIFSFFRHFHRHLDRLVRTNIPTELHGLFFGAPGVAHITASIHQKGLSLVHRSLTSVTRRQVSGTTFNPGETANVLLGSTTGKPQKLEAATTRCVSAVVDAVTFGEAVSAGELQTRLFLPTIQWHVSLLVTRTSLYDVQSVFCLFDWLDSLMDTLTRMRIPTTVVDVDFILDVVRRIFLETDHTITLMRTIAFCYTNFALFLATRAHRRGLADDTLLSPPIFTRLLLSWSPTIRAYFLHLLVFRFGHLTDLAAPPDDPTGQSTRHIVFLLHTRLNDVRDQYELLCREEGRRASGTSAHSSSSSSPVRVPLELGSDTALPLASQDGAVDEEDARRPSTPMPDMGFSKAERVLGISLPAQPKQAHASKKHTVPPVHAMGPEFSTAEHLASNAAFDLQSDEARPRLHLHTASRAFMSRATLVAGPAADVVLHDLAACSATAPGDDVEDFYFERALQPYARQVLREYEQTIKEHDEFTASLPDDEHKTDVPLLTVAWPAMWQGE